MPLPWNTANVKDMSYTFAGAINFNQDLSWNTTSATTLSGMFSGASAFNGDISKFNVKNVVDLSELVRTLVWISFNVPQ
jgi:surface protein